jgi:putative flippase GtrA
VAVAQASDMAVAVLIGLLVAFMLHRASTFANRHAPRPPA